MDSTTRSRDLEALKSAHFSDEDVRLASLSQIVVELFDWIGGPIEVDLLVRMVGYLLKRKRRSDRVIDRAGAARWDAHLSVILDTISSASRNGFDGQRRISASKLHWHTEKNRILRFNREAINRLRNGIILGQLSRGVRPGGLFLLGHNGARAISHLKSGRGDAAPLSFP